jgi:excinuclease UvrABC nuclease subunit
MAKVTESKFALQGKSGTVYRFSIYPIDEECKDESGIYVFTRRHKHTDGAFTHDVIYIGKAKSFEKRFYDHHKGDCIDKNKANCLRLMEVSNETERIKIEKDLLAAHNTSCNEVNN